MKPSVYLASRKLGVTEAWRHAAARFSADEQGFALRHESRAHDLWCSWLRGNVALLSLLHAAGFVEGCNKRKDRASAGSQDTDTGSMHTSLPYSCRDTDTVVRALHCAL